ncbi:DUF4258 domain-containing protein [Mariniluteicoccus endophyticus]
MHPYRITGHVRQRMRQRGVDVSEVEDVLAAPEHTTHDPTEDSYRLERKLPRGTLKVWVVAPWPPKGIIVVKSVAWRGR